MTTGATPQDTGHSDDDVPVVAGVAPDRPVVDGSRMSAEELRAEVEQLQDADRDGVEALRVEELREEVGETVGELAARLDVPARVQGSRDEAVAKVQARKDDAVAAVRQQADRARAVVADKAPAVATTVQSKSGALAGVAAVLVLVLLVVRRRRSRR
jgi:MYXO-CTERM domain-containing protein